MEYSKGDKVVITKETLEKCKRCRVNGKKIDGFMLIFHAMMAGREGVEFKIKSVVDKEVYVVYMSNGNRRHTWLAKSFIEPANNMLRMAVEF